MSKTLKKSAERYSKNHSEKSLLYHLHNRYATDNLYFCRNKFIFDSPGKAWECDGFFMSKSGLTTELECKISRSDWAKEQKDKESKHKFLMETFMTKGENLINPRYNPEKSRSQEFILSAPNYFYVVCQEGLIMPEEVEDAFPYAGLKWVTDEGKILTKKRKKLHPLRIELTQTLLSKFYWRVQELDYNLYLYKKDIESLSAADKEDPKVLMSLIKKYEKNFKV